MTQDSFGATIPSVLALFWTLLTCGRNQSEPRKVKLQIVNQKNELKDAKMFIAKITFHIIHNHFIHFQNKILIKVAVKLL